MSTHSGTQAKKTNVVYISFDDGKEMIRSLYGDLAIKEGYGSILFDGRMVRYWSALTSVPNGRVSLLEFLSLISESRAPFWCLTELVKRSDGPDNFCHKLFNYNPGVSYNPMVESCVIPAKSSSNNYPKGSSKPCGGGNKHIG